MSVGGGTDYVGGRLPARRPFWVGIVVALFLLCGAASALASIIFPSPVGASIQQLLHPGSKLALGEERIAHIPGEFERRSPLFAASWETFKICSQVKECDSAGALAMRDQAIKLDWPKIFDRLMVDGDWGSWADSEVAHSLFLDAVKKWGAQKLRNNCVPVIGFSTVSNGRNSPVYDTDSFTCT